MHHTEVYSNSNTQPTSSNSPPLIPLISIPPLPNKNPPNLPQSCDSILSQVISPPNNNSPHTTTSSPNTSQPATNEQVSHIHNPINFPHFTQASTPPTINSPHGTPQHPALPSPEPVHVSSSSQSLAMESLSRSSTPTISQHSMVTRGKAGIFKP